MNKNIKLVFFVILASAAGCGEVSNDYFNPPVQAIENEADQWGDYRNESEAIVKGTIISVLHDCTAEIGPDHPCGDSTNVAIHVDVHESWTDDVEESEEIWVATRHQVGTAAIGISGYFLLRRSPTAQYCSEEIDLVALDLNLIEPGPNQDAERVYMEEAVYGLPVASSKAISLEEYLGLDSGSC